MKKQNVDPRVPEKKVAKRPYRRPEVHSEEVTEPQGLETCRPVPDSENCVPIT